MDLNIQAKVLGYPIDVACKDNPEYAKLVYWVEKNIIQKQKAANQELLKDGNAKDWLEELNKYVSLLNCPNNVKTVEGQIDWILNTATKIKYMEKKDVYNKYSVGNLKTSNIPNVEVDNILDHIDFQSKEFQTGINKIANILNIPLHNDPIIVLRACTKVISMRLHKQALEKPKDYIVTGMPFPYKEADPGFSLSDDAVKEAAKVLRLLYIGDLRSLQTRVNECIVAVQSVTANPKTDTKLGQVGK